MLDWAARIAESLLGEIVTGLAGGALVALASLGIAYVKRKRVEARFPISGEYLSFFEDTENGETTIVQSTSDITQKGTNVTITTRLKNGRSWTLEGTILPGGHISGVYTADAVYDDGVGSFYLKINHANLDGMWNGYDSANKTTAGGRYWFRRHFSPDVRIATSKDVNDILHTAADAFGYGYVTNDLILDHEGHFVLVAEVDGKFAGFCICDRLESQSVLDFIRLAPTTLPDDVRFADSIGTLGSIKTIAVIDRFRGHGVGSALVKSAERELVARNVTCVLVPAWTIDGKAFIHNLLTHDDYSRWLDNPTYWKEACDKRSFQCSALNGACRCGVTFYRKGRLVDL